MIKIVKLTTGEELIADVERVDGKVSLKKPAAIQLMPSQTNPQQIMVGLFPYAQYAQNHGIDVAESFIVWESTPVDDLYNQYNSMFGSGIQLV
jgi:hypothetical protein